MGEGPIPWTSVNDYAKRWGLGDNEFNDLWQVVAQLDSCYLEARAAKNKIDQKRAMGANPSSAQKTKRRR